LAINDLPAGNLERVGTGYAEYARSRSFPLQQEEYAIGRITVLKKLQLKTKKLTTRIKGTIVIEYLLLVTLVGLGVIVGMSVLREALVNELTDLANAINAINSP
jgi:Flp pilus assembly pilin Flp